MVGARALRRAFHQKTVGRVRRRGVPCMKDVLYNGPPVLLGEARPLIRRGGQHTTRSCSFAGKYSGLWAVIASRYQAMYAGNPVLIQKHSTGAQSISKGERRASSTKVRASDEWGLETSTTCDMLWNILAAGHCHAARCPGGRSTTQDHADGDRGESRAQCAWHDMA